MTQATSEQLLKQATVFNKAWKRLCKGQYENGSWLISRRQRTGNWEVMRDKGATKLPTNFNAFFRTLDDAKRAVNQWEHNDRLKRRVHILQIYGAYYIGPRKGFNSLADARAYLRDVIAITETKGE